MDQSEKNIPPIKRLIYKPGETIIKAGDYGISIYQIVDGSVKVYMEEGLHEVELSTLGPGDIFGEMAYIAGGKNFRSATVRAEEVCVIEVWHPEMIADQLKTIPPTIKAITDQIISRLCELNQLLLKIHKSKEKDQQKRQFVKIKGDEESGTPSNKNRRMHYRKETNTVCTYKPLFGKGVSAQLIGALKDISQTGLSIEISKNNTLTQSHEPGDEFIVGGILPNGKNFEANVKLVNVIDSSKENFRLGMVFIHLSEQAGKTIGFYLMN